MAGGGIGISRCSGNRRLWVPDRPACVSDDRSAARREEARIFPRRLHPRFHGDINMQFHRPLKGVVAGVLFTFGVALAPAAATAASPYPSAPIRIVVGYQAGGPTDLTALLLANARQA